jgi:hypothetical protein
MTYLSKEPVSVFVEGSQPDLYQTSEEDVEQIAAMSRQVEEVMCPPDAYMAGRVYIVFSALC